jgi:hypothetical protein
LGAHPIALLESIGHAEDKDTIVIGLFADDDIYGLPLMQILDKFRIKTRQVRLRYDAIALAADIDQQFRGPDLYYHPFAQIAAAGQIQIQVLLKILLKQFQVGCLGSVIWLLDAAHLDIELFRV